jgi:hypothetical protein
MIKFLILFIITTPVFAIQIHEIVPDTGTISKNQVELPIIKHSKIDTIYVLQGSSVKPWYKDFEVFIGAFLSGLLAALVAIYSINKTNKNNLKNEETKFQQILHNNRSRYCGNLFSIFSELITHTQMHKQKVNEIAFYLEKMTEIKDVVADEPFTTFPIEFLKESRRIILDFGDYRSSILAFLSSYINETVDINNFLNLTKIRKAKEFFDSDDQYVEGIKDYFAEIKNHLERFKITRLDLLDDILEDQNRFKEFSYFEKNTEQMIDLISTFIVTDTSIEKLSKAGIKSQDLNKANCLKDKLFDNYTDFTKALVEIYEKEFFDLNQNIFIKNCRYKTYNEL